MQTDIGKTRNWSVAFRDKCAARGRGSKRREGASGAQSERKNEIEVGRAREEDRGRRGEEGGGGKEARGTRRRERDNDTHRAVAG